MNRWITAIGAIAMVGGGCAPIVLEPLGDAGANASPAAPNALAMRGQDVSPSFIQSSPDALVLAFSSAPQQCGDSRVSATCDKATIWQLILSIPPELDRPGMIDLQDRRIGFDWAVAEHPESCAFGAGQESGYMGTLEITSLDPASVTVKLRGFAPITDLAFDGDYVAHRCGAAPAVPPPIPALAVVGATLPPGHAPSPDPSTLFVVAGDSADTCQDFFSSLACINTSRLSFSLPPDLQHPGKIDLSDPRIDASYDVGVKNADMSCGENIGSFQAGSIDIVSIDPKSIAFKVFGSYSFAVDLSADFEVDGMYAAPICP